MSAPVAVASALGHVGSPTRTCTVLSSARRLNLCEKFLLPEPLDGRVRATERCGRSPVRVRRWIPEVPVRTDGRDPQGGKRNDERLSSQDHAR